MEKKNHKILVVDDDPNSLELSVEIFAQTTYEVFTSLSGEVIVCSEGLGGSKP